MPYAREKLYLCECIYKSMEHFKLLWADFLDTE